MLVDVKVFEGLGWGRAAVLVGLFGLLSACREPERAVQESRAAEPWREMVDAWEPLMGGEVSEEAGVLSFARIEMMTAARWTGEIPTGDFEFEGEARRMVGTDFFFGLTFPLGSSGSGVSLIVGGWGGDVVGISSIDGRDASENETTSMVTFEEARWYAIRMRLAEKRLEVWIDGERVVDLPTEGRRFGLRSGPIEECAPFGLATWETAAEMRGLRWRPLGPSED